MARSILSDALRNFKFNVLIPRTLPSSSGITGTAAMFSRLGFTTAQGIGAQVQPVTYREGGDNVTPRQMPGQTAFTPLVLSRGLFPTDVDSWYWFRQMFDVTYGDGLEAVEQEFRSDIILNVLSHPTNNASATAGFGSYNYTYPQQPIVQVSMKFYSCWPAGLSYSDFDAGANAVAIEQLTLMHEGFDVMFAGNTVFSGTNPWPAS